jgi:hypothetical protein
MHSGCFTSNTGQPIAVFSNPGIVLPRLDQNLSDLELTGESGIRRAAEKQQDYDFSHTDQARGGFAPKP